LCTGGMVGDSLTITKSVSGKSDRVGTNIRPGKADRGSGQMTRVDQFDRERIDHLDDVGRSISQAANRPSTGDRVIDHAIAILEPMRRVKTNRVACRVD